MSFLSSRSVNEGGWSQRDGAWQVGCVLLALICGKSPFQRDSLTKTLLAVEKCDADLSEAGDLRGACQEIIKGMRAAQSLGDFKETLG